MTNGKGPPNPRPKSMKRPITAFRRLVAASKTIDEANELIAQKMAEMILNVVKTNALKYARDKSVELDLARKLADNEYLTINFNYYVNIDTTALIAALGPMPPATKAKPTTTKKKGEAEK